LGVLSLEGDSETASQVGVPTQHCRVMFGAERSEVVEERYMRSNFYGLNPYGFKIWEERINAFRVIASVDFFEFSLRESGKISQGSDYEIITAQERSVIACAYVGMTAAETAESLHRSVATINAHRRAVARKLNCALTPIVIARIIYAHKAIQEMCDLGPQIGLGKHYRISDHSTHADLLRAIS
jgi:DNA-binding CsgD family transcriptional regulator